MFHRENLHGGAFACFHSDCFIFVDLKTPPFSCRCLQPAFDSFSNPSANSILLAENFNLNFVERIVLNHLNHQKYSQQSNRIGNRRKKSENWNRPVGTAAIFFPTFTAGVSFIFESQRQLDPAGRKFRQELC